MRSLTFPRLLLVLGLFTGTSLGQAGAPQETPKDPSAPASPTVAGASTPATPSLSTAAPAARRPHFVPVLITAANGGGSPATGLSKEQFTILDSGHAVQPLQVFKAQDIPLHLAIVLLGSTATFSQQQAAAIDLVKKAVRPKIDEAFVVTARGKKSWPSDRLEWKQDPEELVKIIAGLDRNAGLHDAFDFDMQTSETGIEGGRDTVQTYNVAAMSVFDAVFYMMNADPHPARRVLVIFRDPWAHSPGFGIQVNSTVEGRMQQAIAVAQEMHIATFVIGLEDTRFNGVTDNTIGKNYISVHSGENGGGGEGDRNFDRAMEKERVHAYDAGKTNVQRLATETGGTTFWSTKKNFSDAVNGIANLLEGQYILTFTPGDVPGPVHTLKVTSSGAANVLAPSAFFYGAPQPGPPK